MRSAPLLVLAASLVAAAPSPFPPVGSLAFPLNATLISVPPPSEGVTGTPVSLQGNPAVKGNTTLVKPFVPAGGVVEDQPIYKVVSSYDFQSLNLALYQELFELDLFNYALKTFTPAEFEAAGIDKAGQDLIRFMGEQEIGHSEAIISIIGPERASRQCTYAYPFTTVEQFILYAQIATRVGESGVIGFIPHLDSRPSAELVLLAITTESRQQMVLRQFQGLFPFPVWVETPISQSMAWSILSNYVHSCPSNNTRVEWEIFPALTINQPDELSHFKPAITTDTVLTAPGRVLELSWECPGRCTGPDLAYKTSVSANGPAKYAAFISQAAVLYSPLYDVKGNCAKAKQPGGDLFPGDPAINGTMFVAIVDAQVPITPFNISLLNDHILAFSVYLSG